MPEQMELEVAAPDTAAQSSESAQETAFDQNTDASDGTENAVERDGNDAVDGQDGQANKDVVDTERQKSEKKISGIQKRLNELTRDKYAERQAREALERQNIELMAMLKGGTQKPAEADNGKPRQDQFTDYAEFVKADAIWHAVKAAEEKIAAERAAMTENSQRQALVQSEQQADAAYAQRAAAVAKTVPDFEETMSGADVQLPNRVLAMIKRVDNGPMIAYHMAKNPALAQQFFGQSAEMQGVLLGQLSATLKSSTKVSNAPPPGKTVKSQAGSSSEPPEDIEAYMAWAAKNMR